MNKVRKLFMASIAILLAIVIMLVIPSEEAEAYSNLNYTGSVYVTTADVNVRSGPGTSYESYGILPKYTAIEGGQIRGESGNWTKFRIWTKSGKEKVGYINTTYIKKTTSNRVYTATTSVNLRSGPSVSFSIVATLDKNSGQQLYYGYKVTANGYTWVATEDCDINQKIGSSTYYICAKAWTVFSYYK